MSWKAIKTTYSSKTGEKYYIKQDTATKNYSCTCKSWVFSNESPKICKHIAAVLVSLQKKKVQTFWVIKNNIGELASSVVFETQSTAEHYSNVYKGKAVKVRLVEVK